MSIRLLHAVSLICLVPAAVFVVQASSQFEVPSDSWPAARACFGFTYSPTHGAVVFGGAPSCGRSPIPDRRLWSWNGRAWTVLTQVPDQIGIREDVLLAAVPGRGTLLLHGGRRNADVFADTWEWNGTEWRRVWAEGGPGPREHAAAAFDPKRSRLVVFGGSHRSRQAPFGDTWEWNGQQWIRVATSGDSPAPRVGHLMTWSPRHGEVLLYGGFAARSFLDAWSWNGARWRRLASTGPGATEGQSGAGTPLGLTILTGEPTASSSTVSRFTGEWSRAGADGPAVLIGQSVVYDTKRDRLVVFGGHAPDRAAARRDVWEFDGRLWTTLSASGRRP